MKTVKAIIVGMVCLTAGAANAQWVVSDPGNLAPVSYTHLTLPTTSRV